MQKQLEDTQRKSRGDYVNYNFIDYSDFAFDRRFPIMGI